MRRPGGPPVPPRRYGLFTVLLMGLLLAGVGVWYLVSPYTFFQVVYRIRPVTPRVESLTVRINGNPRTFPTEETLGINPGDYLTVETVTSNLQYNVGLNLKMPDIDPDGLNGRRSLLEIMGEEAFVEPYEFSILVENREEVVAAFHFVAAMTALDWATRAKKADDDEKKIYYLKLAEKLEPENPFILENLAVLLEKTGDFLAAAKLYDRCLGRKGSRVTLEKILSVYLKTDRRERITGIYRELIDRSQPVTAVKYLADLAGLQVEWEQYQPAARTYEELVQGIPDREKSGPLKSLLAIYQKLADRPKTIETYQRLMKIVPRQEAVKYALDLGRLFERDEQWDQALAVYQGLTSELPPRKAAAVWKKIGLIEAKNNNIEEAVKAYEAAGEIDKNDKNIQVNLARLYLLKGDRENYRKGLVNLLKIDPEDTDVRYELAQALLQDGRDDAAAEHFGRLLEKDPERIEARLALLGILEKKGDRAAMAPHYQYLLEKNPENNVLAYNLGIIYLETGKLAQAEEMMTKVTSASPEDADAQKYLYDIYKKQNKTEEAVRTALALTALKPDEDVWYEIVFQHLKEKKDWPGLVKAAGDWVEHRPKSAVLLERLATAQLGADQAGEAARTYERLVEMDPKNVANLLKLANIYEKADNAGEAVKVLAKVLEIDPENKEAGEAHIRLKLKVLGAKHRQ